MCLQFGQQGLFFLSCLAWGCAPMRKKMFPDLGLFPLVTGLGALMTYSSAWVQKGSRKYKGCELKNLLSKGKQNFESLGILMNSSNRGNTAALNHGPEDPTPQSLRFQEQMPTLLSEPCDLIFLVLQMKQKHSILFLLYFCLLIEVFSVLI